MLKNNEIAFSIQKQRYINFWKIRFPTLLKEFFEIKFKTNSKLSQSIPAIQKIKTYQKAISEKERKNSVSAFLYRSKLEKLFITLQFQHNKKYNLLLGEIPKIDDKGLFEIDGNNRVIIGYLGKPLGLNFSEKDEKYKAYFRTQSRRSRGLKIIIKNLKKKPKLSIKCGSEELDSRVVKKLLGKKIYTEFEKKYDIGEPDAKRGKKFSVDKKIEEIKKCYISKSGRIYTNIKLKETYKKLNLISTESPYIAIEDIIATLHWLSDKFTKSSKLTPDEKYSLENKQLYLIDDLLEAKVWDAMEIIWSYLTKSLRTENLTIKEFIEILQSILNTKRDCKSLRTFTHEIINLFISHPLSRPINTNNLLETASFQRRISLIDLEDNISDKALYFDRKARDLHWSHYGRLCPIDTPQGDDVGLVYSLSKNAIVEDGIIKAPYYRIEGGQKISKKADYLSPSEEKDFWIAYSGQEEKILRGEDVFARKGSEELVLKSPQEVQYIDYSVEQPFSWASLLVPFLCHNDANRVLMASNSMRQALPLLEKDTPWIKTGYEKKLVDESGFKNDENAEFTIKDGEFAFGQNLLVGYLSYKGLNFEDAIVISETAAKKLTSIQFRIFKEKVIANYIDFIQQNRKVVKQEIMTNDEEEIKNFNLKHINIPKNIQKLGIDGIIIEGKTFVEGDVLVRKFVKQTLAGEYSDVSYIAPRGSHGTVFKIEKEKLVTEDMYIKITAKIERPVKVGDKLANRHGGKGVVSAIIPDNKMPYFLDEKTKQNSPLEVILNPLGVFSRLNIGQLFETHLGLVLSRKNQKNKNVILSPLEQYSFDKLKCEFKNVNLPEDGKLLVKFHDNNKNIWESAGEVVVGYQYIMRLEHIAEEKLNSRDLPGEKYYSKISQQPTRGKEDYGGQRIGEMEVWALVAHNANNILREMLTLKSDNPHEKRVELKNVFASKTMPVSYIPEFLRVFLIYLCGLGIDMQLFDSANNSIDILSRDTKCLPLNFEPEMIQNATLSVANLYDKEKCEGWSCGEVSNLIIGYDTEGYKDDGLFSQVIFGPIKDNKCKCRFRSKKAIDNQKCPNCKVVIGSSKMRNYRMGYIELPQPIVNPLFIIQVAKLLLIPEASLKKLLFNKKYLLSDLNLLSDLIISFKGNKNTQRFLELLRGIGIVYENPMEIAEEILKRKIKEIVINDRFMVMEKLLIYKECTKYLIKYLPVIPPVYRPYTVISGGTQLRICGDINSHYLDILAFCNKKNREKIDSVGIQKSVAIIVGKNWTTF